MQLVQPVVGDAGRFTGSTELATATFATQQSICKYRDTDDPEVDVTFVKFDADNCSGLDSGGEQKVEHGVSRPNALTNSVGVRTKCL